MVSVSATSAADVTQTSSTTLTITSNVAVTVAPPTPPVLINNQYTFTATVTNDPGLKGVTFAVTCPDVNPCGSVGTAGAPTGNPETYSWHAMIHTVAFFVAFISLIAACIVLARTGGRRWAAYSVATAVLPIPLIALSMATGGSGVPLVVMGAITSAWVAALPARLIARTR